jgi:hypothetical protein
MGVINIENNLASDQMNIIATEKSKKKAQNRHSKGDIVLRFNIISA